MRERYPQCRHGDIKSNCPDCSPTAKIRLLERQLAEATRVLEWYADAQNYISYPERPFIAVLLDCGRLSKEFLSKDPPVGVEEK